MGLTYNWETAAVTVGINNITDEQPPLISQNAGPNRNNAVASARYDMIGQSYFMNFTKSF
jgi:outer membrane receptor protein involved in Fe transport